MKSRIGATVRGKWRIDAQLGRGSMATVYAATHRNGTRVALKMLHPHLSRDEGVRTRFLREGYLANRVNHPGTVRITDDDVSEDGCAFLVMELLEGETLDQRRRSLGGRIAPADALPLFGELLDIVAAAHDQGLVHRDLKPDNVFLSREGKVKILDFGVANVWDGQRSSEMTVTGMVIGTPSFMPPEQALGQRDAVDKRSDLWAVGACLFTALTGEPVHPEVGSAHLKILITAQQPARSLASVLPDLPPSLVHAVDTALAFEKERRFPDARAMKRALAQAAKDLAAGPDSVDERTRIRPDAMALARALDDQHQPETRRGERDPETMRQLPSLLDDDAEPSTERMGSAGLAGLGLPELGPNESVVTSAPVFPLARPRKAEEAAEPKRPTPPPLPPAQRTSAPPPLVEPNLVPSAFPPHTPFGRTTVDGPSPLLERPAPPAAASPLASTALGAGLGPPAQPYGPPVSALAQHASFGPATSSPPQHAQHPPYGPATSAGPSAPADARPMAPAQPAISSAPPYAAVPPAPRVPHISTPHTMASTPSPLKSQLDAPPPMTGGGLRFLVPLGLVAVAIVGGYVLYVRRMPPPPVTAAKSARPPTSALAPPSASSAAPIASAAPPTSSSSVVAIAPATGAATTEPPATGAATAPRPRVRVGPRPPATATATTTATAAVPTATVTAEPTATATATATQERPQPLSPAPAAPADPE